MELRDIEYFAVVAEHGHLGRAAEALGLSTPALSKSLRRLEGSLQAKLVKRTPKGVELTAEGNALLSRVRGLRLSLADVTREIADLSQGRTGHLRVDAHPGAYPDLLGLAVTRPVSSRNGCSWTFPSARSPDLNGRAKAAHGEGRRTWRALARPSPPRPSGRGKR